MKKFSPLVLLFLWAWGSPVLAEDGEGKSLRDRIRSVSSRLFMKAGRVEASFYPLTSVSINDAFYQKLGIGASLAYHLNEAFAIQALVTYTLPALNLSTGNAAYHGPAKGTSIPYAGKRSLLASADLCWAPVYGKVSLAAETVLHFDTYLIAGLGVIGGEIRTRTSGSTSASLEGTFGIAGDFGLGVRLFLNESLALKMELKDYMIFNDKVSYVDVKRSDVQHQLLFNLGLSIFMLEGTTEE